MSGPSRREIERRVEDLSDGDEEFDHPPEWREGVPRELWGDVAAIWQYDLTQGESHPNLPSPEELAERAGE